jgi:hypothetical protein
MVAYRFARAPQPDDGMAPALSFGSDDDVALNK